MSYEESLPHFFTDDERKWYDTIEKRVLFAIARDLASQAVGIGHAESKPNAVLPYLLDIQRIIQKAGYANNLSKYNRMLCNGFTMESDLYYNTLNEVKRKYGSSERIFDQFLFSDLRHEDDYAETWQSILDTSSVADIVKMFQRFYDVQEVDYDSR